MFIESTFNIMAKDDTELAHIQNTLKASLFDLTGSEATFSLAIKSLALEPLIKEITSAGPFLDADQLTLIEELMEEFDLSSARMVFLPSSEWRYGLLTDQGVEYVGRLELPLLGFPYEPLVSADLLSKGIPLALPLLALFGPDPDDTLLAKFRSYQFSWIGLRDDIDRQTFFTCENIRSLWEQLDKASQYFIDQSTALKLAGHLR